MIPLFYLILWLLNFLGFFFSDEEVDDLRGGIGHFGFECLNFGSQHAVAPQGDNSNTDTESRSNESFGDSLGNRTDPTGPGQSHAAERIDDTTDGTEQSDKRRRRGDGGQGVQTFPQLLVEDVLGSVTASLGRFDLLLDGETDVLAFQKLGDSGRGNTGQMADLVFFLGSKSQGFFDLSFFQQLSKEDI